MASTKLQRSPSSGLKQPENSNAMANEIPIIALKHHLARRIIKQKQISRRKMVLPVKVAVRFIARLSELKGAIGSHLGVGPPGPARVPSSLIGLQSKCSTPARFRTRCHL